MNLEKVKKLRKGLVIALVAGVVFSQAAPVLHSGEKAHASTDDTEVVAEAVTEQEEVLQETEETTVPEPEPESTEESAPAEDISEDQTDDSADTDTEGTTDDSSDDNVAADPTAGDDASIPLDDPAAGDDASVPSDDLAAGDDTDAPADDPAVTDDTDAPADELMETPQATIVPPESNDAGIVDSKKAEKLKKSKTPETRAFYEQAAGRIAETEAKRTEAEETGTDYYPVPAGRLVPSPVIYQGFRFWTVAPDYAFASADIDILEEKDASSRSVGTLAKDGMCYILKTEQDGWCYIESGSVRGFVQGKDLVTGLGAQEILERYQADAEKNRLSIEAVAPMAESLVDKDDNEAFDYYRATVYQTIVKKDYALPEDGAVNIREEASEDGRVVGVLPEDGLAYVITDRNKDWVYVESGDVRGFVRNDVIVMMQDTDTDADTFLEKEEDDYAEAKILIEPRNNEALYYTITSVKSGVPDGMVRSSLLQYAAEFIGNPYVWGGTSLTNGADCSGFVQSIFAQYGYTLPRTAAEQSQVGTQIPVKDAQPGDLIFYGNGDRIYHVVIYAGEGTTIEAKSSKYGIVAANVNYGSAVWATRIIEDEDQAVRYDIPDGLGSIHTYMGWQKITMKGSQQYAFRESAGMAFDPEGFGVVDNRYVIACTTSFGNIGDYVDFYQEDGSVIPCIIGDFKNQNDAACNVYGHMNGENIVEFVVDMNSWYPSHANPGTSSCHPEWDQDIVKAENVGSYYD